MASARFKVAVAAHVTHYRRKQDALCLLAHQVHVQSTRLSLSGPAQCAFGRKKPVAVLWRHQIHGHAAHWWRTVSAGDPQLLLVALSSAQSAWRAPHHHWRSQPAGFQWLAEACCGGLRRFWPGQVQGYSWRLHRGEMAALSSDVRTRKTHTQTKSLRPSAACILQPRRLAELTSGLR